jgi:DNA-binding NtrC family response regulator
MPKRSKAATSTDPHDPSTQPSKPSSPVVLVVEDDVDVRKMLEAAIRSFGFTAKLARNGAEAVTLHNSDAVDIVLMDVQMPGMDGPATLQALLQQDPDTLCCFMSGHTGKYTVAELLDCGAADIIAKPFHLAELKHVLENALAKRE